MSLPRILDALLLAALLSIALGCGTSAPTTTTTDPSDPTAQTNPQDTTTVKGMPGRDYVRVEVFYGTDRARTGSEDPVDFYGGDRGELELGTMIVTVPKGHQVGQLESPVWWKLEFEADPTKHIVLEDINPDRKEVILDRMNKAVARSDERALLVFIHGYNVTFEDAARRTAQIAYDLPYDGVPLLYSWPANGSLLDYTADEADARWTAPHLKGLLRDLVDESGADKIHLIAHSMGNRVLTSALVELQREIQEPIFNEVVLTAPDIDADVFQRDIVPAIVPLADRITLYASSQDRALNASRSLHGYPRAGESGENMVLVEGVETVDASDVDTDLLGHNYFAQTQAVLVDLYNLIRYGSSPDQRNLKREEREGRFYWVLP